jgi:hypothetical protein
LEGLLARHLAAKRKAKIKETLDEHLPIWQATRSVRRSPKLERLQQARREERLARYEQVIALRRQGRSYEAIAREVGMGASTVQSWLATGTFPEKKPREQATQLDRYQPYLFERWESGCHNMTRLFRELVNLGYKGSYASVREHLVRQLEDRQEERSKRKRAFPCPSVLTTSSLPLPASARKIRYGSTRACSHASLDPSRSGPNL